MKVNGMRMANRMAVVYKLGQMDLSMRGTGKMAMYTVEVGLFIQMEMFKRVNGNKTKLMGTGPTHMQMVQDMKVVGVKTSNTAKEKNHGLMERSTKANT